MLNADGRPKFERHKSGGGEKRAWVRDDRENESEREEKKKDRRREEKGAWGRREKSMSKHGAW